MPDINDDGERWSDEESNRGPRAEGRYKMVPGEGDLRCPNAHPVRVDGETVVKRCRGNLVRSQEYDGYVCSDEGEEMRFAADVVESFKVSSLWHRAFAVNKMLVLLVARNPTAYNSSYPWIEIPLGLSQKAMVETTTGSWDVHIHQDDYPVETRPINISTESEDTEAVARAIAEALSD